MTPTGRMLTCKELADALRKNVSYVYAMRRRGFVMVADVATVEMAVRFIKRVPHPRGSERTKTAANGRTRP